MIRSIGLLAVALFGVAGAGVAETQLERGEYLVRGPMGCGNCHTPQGPEGPDMSRELGGFTIEQNEMMTAVAANITPGGRVAEWSDAELARAIREGIRPDGSVIGPPMPISLYRGLGDEDLAAVVTFLRTMPAVENDPGVSVYSFPLPPAWGPPVESVTPPERAATAEYGAYLAGPVAHCLECHTTFGEQGPMFETHLGAGGLEFHGPWGTSVAANITSHADGLAGYSDDEIRRMITEGVEPDGSALLPPMPYAYLARMTPGDLDAVVAFLRTLQPLPSPK